MKKSKIYKSTGTISGTIAKCETVPEIVTLLIQSILVKHVRITGSSYIQSGIQNHCSVLSTGIDIFRSFEMHDTGSALSESASYVDQMFNSEKSPPVVIYYHFRSLNTFIRTIEKKQEESLLL